VDLNRQTELIPARLRALDNLARRLSQLAGRKQLLWISYGVPSTMRLYPDGFVDVSKNLRQFGRGIQSVQHSHLLDGSEPDTRQPES
jgi:hypothetical protein